VCRLLSLASCAPGTSFCLAVGNLDALGYSAIVTTDGGAGWQDYETLPAGMAYPYAGPAAGGTTVIIKGTNLRHVTAVDFGSAAGRDVKVISGTELTVRAPAGKQAVYVKVVTSDGGPSPLTGRSVFNFLAKPALTKLSPGSGPARGGTTVTISGSGLAFLRDVYFGARLAGHLRVVSAREIKVTAPAGTGKVPVKIVTAGGTTPLVKAGYFSY
jgi:hypothetical protein